MFANLFLVSLACALTPTILAQNYWFSFGDSYTATAFDVGGTLPAPGNPLGNPPYPGYTTTGGNNWIDSMTVTYNRSLVLTYNYAYGGATIDANLVPPYDPSVKSMTDQVNQFLSTVAGKPESTPWTSENALFSIWIGINDIGGSFGAGGDRAAFSDTLLSAEFALVQKLYDVGARNFLFVGVPPVYRSPTMMAQGQAAMDLEHSVIDTHNYKYVGYVNNFKAQHPDVQTWIWDSNKDFISILDNPTAFGLNANVNEWGNQGDFWGNDYHPSAQAHTVLAQFTRQALGDTIW